MSDLDSGWLDDAAKADNAAAADQASSADAEADEFFSGSDDSGGWLGGGGDEGGDDDWLGIGDGLEVDESELRDRFAIEQTLRQLTNKIHSSSLEELLLYLGPELVKLLECERATIYVLDRLKREIYSKTSVEGEIKEIRVPVGSQSLAGYVAISGRTLRIADAYDDNELRQINSDLTFDISWDQRTGFRTKQILAVPVKAQRRVEGVIQLVNNTTDREFTVRHERTLLEVAQTLSIAFANQRHMTVRRSRFDELYAQELINEEMLDEARKLSRSENISIEAVLIEKYKVPKKEILLSLSKFYRVSPVEFADDTPTPIAMIEHFTIDYLKHHRCVPMSMEDGKATVAMANPKDILLRDEIASRLDVESVKILVALTEDVLKFIDAFYPEPEEIDEEAPDTNELSDLMAEMTLEAEAAAPEAEEAKEDVKEDSGGLVRLVNQIIEHAYKRGCSDIHVEPYPESDTVVRFRIDGVCQQYTTVPRSFAKAMLSRLKIMSGLDISERRLPQDGKIKFKKYGSLDIELRVATLPTVGGLEDCVMRILAASEPLPLDAMGFSPENLERFKDSVSQPYGLVLVVGPTGSGKTTTLHSALGFINKPETKIWTAEDPVEITQRGLRQVQIHKKIGFDFAKAMKAFLRADPDVIMIGEMRDAETAEAGVEASLTGHLVFSTLHTNSAPETVTRLLDMGLDPYSFGDSLLGVLAQRLMRRLCKDCKVQYEPTAEEIAAIKKEYDYDKGWERLKLDENITLFQPVGCVKCGGGGYKGRMGIHEYMPNNDVIRQIVYSKGKVSEIRESALEYGMSTLKQDGIRKVLQGFTDLKEVRRVCIN